MTYFQVLLGMKKARMTVAINASGQWAFRTFEMLCKFVEVLRFCAPACESVHQDPHGSLPVKVACAEPLLNQVWLDLARIDRVHMMDRRLALLNHPHAFVS